MTGRPLEVQLRAHRDVAREADGWVEAFLRDAGVGGDLRHDVELVVSELVNNAYRHGYDCADGGPIRLRIVLDPRQVKVVVEDNGKGMPQRAEVSDPTAPHRLESTRGRGLFLARRLGERLEIERKPHGTRVTVELKRP